jgi:hypothetical protein
VGLTTSDTIEATKPATCGRCGSYCPPILVELDSNWVGACCARGSDAAMLRDLFPDWVPPKAPRVLRIAAKVLDVKPPDGHVLRWPWGRLKTETVPASMIGAPPLAPVWLDDDRTVFLESDLKPASTSV